jgi:RNA polymerase sigma-70 factor, ECF subfamily
VPNNDLDFERVYAMFQPKIYRYLTRLIGTKEVEDLTQEVFIRVDNSFNTLRNQSQISTWIYKIATNAARDRMRSSSFKREVTEKPSAIEAELNSENGCLCNNPLSIEEQVIRKEMNQCIQQCITFLPENLRTILVLSDVEGLKNSEIAEILGLNLSTVKIRLHRAKASLKQVLLANCDFYRTECNDLACEPKGPVLKKIKPSARKTLHRK